MLQGRLHVIQLLLTRRGKANSLPGAAACAMRAHGAGPSVSQSQKEWPRVSARVCDGGKQRRVMLWLFFLFAVWGLMS